MMSAVSRRKQNGIHYTPQILSDFVAKEIVALLNKSAKEKLSIFDPAVGDGKLLVSLIKEMNRLEINNLEVSGMDIDENAINIAKKLIHAELKNKKARLLIEDFLKIIKTNAPVKYDVVISNPPYVRTQVLGADKARELTKDFKLGGKVDLYQVFILGIAKILKEDGIVGLIVSNKFMTTKTGRDIRKLIPEEFEILHVWDLGDTRIFPEAAVLPAVLLLRKKPFEHRVESLPRFTSIYSTDKLEKGQRTHNVISALSKEGIVETESNQKFLVRNGYLDIKQGDVWKIVTDDSKRWIETIRGNTWVTFSDIGKIRVGVKTTADKIFIRNDWDELSEDEQPELLRPLITHEQGRRFKPIEFRKESKILYPHSFEKGERVVVDLEAFPKSKKYLLEHKKTLESRKYLKDAGRKWYEIWVPQNPDSWKEPKVVFRDITEKPVFWIDLSGKVINGNCYWFMSEKINDIDMLWLAMAVGNSSFIEFFYDLMFHNKLYSNRRRFMSQYVSSFPIPDPSKEISKKIVQIAKEIYENLASSDSNVANLSNKLDGLAWEAFGLSPKEVGW